MFQGAVRPAVVDQPATRREELDLQALVVGLVFIYSALIFGIGGPEPGRDGIPGLWGHLGHAAAAGLGGLPGVGVHGDGRALILQEP